MANDSAIEWTEATWNPVTGCSRVSAGCDHCYAVAMTHRLEAMGQPKYAGLTVLNGRGDRHFNGAVRCHEDALEIPLRWRTPRRIFVNSMSDLFHPDVPDAFIGAIFGIAKLAPQHTFQILTKRPERAASWFVEATARIPRRRWMKEALTRYGFDDPCLMPETDWPLPNVWLGCSVEDQPTADERIPHLLRCPAAVRFLSLEPLLGLIDLNTSDKGGPMAPVDWIIVGGESGPGARPMHPDWARSIRDQCRDAGVPFFFKQWGAWCGGLDFARDSDDDGRSAPIRLYAELQNGEVVCESDLPAGAWHTWKDEENFTQAEEWVSVRIGKKRAGRLLDGREWSEWPDDLRVRQWPEERSQART